MPSSWACTALSRALSSLCTGIIYKTKAIPCVVFVHVLAKPLIFMGCLISKCNTRRVISKMCLSVCVNKAEVCCGAVHERLRHEESIAWWHINLFYICECKCTYSRGK